MFGNKRKKKNTTEEIKLDLESLIRKAYAHLMDISKIDIITVEQLEEDFPENSSFVIVRTRGFAEQSPFFFTASADFLNKFKISLEPLDSKGLIRWAYPVSPLFWMFPSEDSPGEYQLPFYYLDPFRGKDEDRQKLFWDSSPCDIYRCSDDGGNCFYLSIESRLASHIFNSLSTNTSFVEACNTFVLDKPGLYHRPANPEDPIEVKIKDPGTFLAGRFFLPMELKKKPDIRCSIRSAALSPSGRYFADQKGLWFKFLFTLQGGKTEWPMFYFFHQGSKALEEAPFRQMIKIITKKMREQFSFVSLQISQMKGQFCGPPPPLAVSKCFLLNYYLTSGSTIVSGSLMIPHSLLSFLVRNFAFPWSLVATADNPLNQLRMLFSFNQLLFGREGLSLLPSRSESNRAETIEDFRETFLTLNDLILLSSPREVTLLLTNFLYPRGWTGESLPRLFYYLETLKTEDEEKESLKQKAALYTLIGFQEEKLLNSMPKNMRAQWPANGPSGYGLLSHEGWIEENFQLMKELYKAVQSKNFSLPFRLNRILQREFKEYGDCVTAYRSLNFDSEKQHLEITKDKKPLLQDFFYHLSSEDGGALFFFHPKEMDIFGKLIPPAKRDSFEVQISRMKDHPEDEDEILKKAMKIRDQIQLLRPEDYV